MRAVVQRVSRASVEIEGHVTGEIGEGLAVLLGVSTDDTEDDAKQMADRIAGLRCFMDDDGKFNRSLEDVQGSVLAVSQFTLLGDCRRGRRPSFIHAARPGHAIPLYEHVVSLLRERSIPVETGEFGAFMNVSLVNEGPVTLLLDTRKVF